ncbi:alpha/beta hydrolase [Brumimicrobium glaciale]|uniref:Alpha/beta hydrolase n=1 Tax=Brumimicrobium glaciale TaxID=200475 RepID=A0A4Q4KTF8_9FLAO|nr:alpha/beta hydrolase [Brumimicrobium glaciale]RYM36029.1 alpha/beta hydrolase [Brumimicrobium glaciale]
MNKKQILNYRIVGNGYPVVFLHGFLESNKMWENLLKHLPKIQAICIELPGHGESSLLQESLSLERITEAVKETILEVTKDQFSIVGHSLGGYVALHLAEDDELKIDQITLLHSHPWADSDSKKVDRGRVVRIVEYNKMLFLKDAIPQLYYKPEFFETKINHLIEEAYEMTEEAIAQTLIAMRDREDKSNVLKTWKERIHIIQGEFDSLIDAKKLQKQAEKIGNTFHLIKSIGHMGHHENEKEVIRLLTFTEKK